MAGELKLDEGGIASLVRELHVHGAGSDEHAAQADAALAAAAGAVSSAPLAAAVNSWPLAFAADSTTQASERPVLGAR
ncbi:hypothetical protein EDF42_3468 [Curtobacterium sp. PhB172]|nr:hypothetical protein EDF42_3468 [Curtobacterium sp. PhB172]